MIPDHDDDVMDSMKEASCSFLLFQEFAKRAERASPEMITAVKKIEEPLDAEETKEAIELDLLNVLPDELDPKVTYGEAVRLRILHSKAWRASLIQVHVAQRIIMTRPDYIVDLVRPCPLRPFRRREPEKTSS